LALGVFVQSKNFHFNKKKLEQAQSLMRIEECCFYKPISNPNAD